MTSLQFFSGRRIVRHLVVALVYAVISFFALAGGYLVRFDFWIDEAYYGMLLQEAVWVAVLKVACLMIFSEFGSLLTFFSIPDIRKVAAAGACAALVLFGVWYASSGSLSPPRGVILCDFVLFVSLVAGFRFSLRAWRERGPSAVIKDVRPVELVAIVGAGEAGAGLARELLSKPSFGLNPVAFLDDDREKWGAQLHGVIVAGGPEWLLGNNVPKGLRRVIIAMPSANRSRVNEIVEKLEGRGLQLDTIPSLDQILNSGGMLAGLRPLRIDDLLGRAAAELNSSEIQQILVGRVIAVTGAGGSIGSELCRQILSYGPKSLLLIEQCEGQLFQIEQELVAAGHQGLLVPLVADICDADRIKKIFAEHHPEIVFHAAAHKHVPLMESQPGEAIKNNAVGTSQLARLAHDAGVERFVLISTDKAINPTNVMGATKRMAEMFLQGFQSAHPVGTRFISVRFGNVLGSSGSVVPIFEKQIAAGGPVMVTHPEVTRYFMTIPEAVGLVLQSCSMGQGGEIFLLDMGKPMLIAELAKQMILLKGLQPGSDIKIEFTGLRPGEKLFEELNYSNEAVDKTSHPKVFRLTPSAPDLEHVITQLAQLTACNGHTSTDEIKRRMVQLVPEYRPQLKRSPVDHPGTPDVVGRQSA